MRLPRFLLLALAASLALAVPAGAQGPPPPTSTKGHRVQTVARDVPLPTQFAFARGVVFVAAAGSEDSTVPGGVYAIKGGKVRKLPGSPPLAFGVVWHRGKLYVTSGARLLVWSGWNGKRFRKRRELVDGAPVISSFTGLAWSRGRLYTGVSFDDDTEFSRPADHPYQQSYVSIRPNGSHLKVVARGLRQPWMSTFVKGRPYLTVLAADNVEPAPPDYIVVPRRGQDYGFPMCDQTKAAACGGFAKPLVLLPSHASPMGIGAIGRTLYVALFGGMGNPQVVSVPTRGGKPKPFLTGYVAPVVALGTHHGWVYTGDVTGTVYRTRG